LAIFQKKDAMSPIRILMSAALALLAAPALAVAPLSITLVHGNAAEVATQAQLQRLLSEYKVERWQFTSRLRIDADTIPHSHPVLTLHARHLKQDDLLLSTYVHEQLHWHLQRHPAQTKAALRELRQLYPSLPVGYPQGADSEVGNYEHLLINWLELKADRELLGEERAQQALQFWQGDHYTALYKTVADDSARIEAVLVRHKLMW
jgi:hypothetical protein